MTLHDAEEHGSPPECTARLRELIPGTHARAFRKALTGKPPVYVDPMAVQRKPGARPARAKPIVYPPHKAPWLAAHKGKLTATDRVSLNDQANSESVAIVIPKGQRKRRFSIVSDCRAFSLIQYYDRASRHANAELGGVSAVICSGGSGILHAGSHAGILAHAFESGCSVLVYNGDYQRATNPNVGNSFETQWRVFRQLRGIFRAVCSRICVSHGCMTL